MRTDSLQLPSVAPVHRLPALWLAFLLAAGIFLDRLISPPLIVIGLLWLSAVLTMAVASQFRSGLNAFQRFTALGVILLTGMLLSSLFIHTLAVKRQFTQTPVGRVALKGYVCSPVRSVSGRYNNAGRLEFDLDVAAEKRSADTSWRRVYYRLRVNVDNPGQIKISGGDCLALAAELMPVDGYANPGGFDWREYWGRRFVAGRALVASGEHIRQLHGGGRPGVRGLAAGIQARLLELHERLYPEPGIRAVASAILLGDRRGVDSATLGAFARSGTIHVLVVSGLHLGFIAGVLYLLLSLALGRGLASAGITSALLLLYALATGGRPPVVRAWLLVTFAMFALPAGRRGVILNSLAAAFAVLLMVNPSWLRDPGFQLSFAAVAGIGLTMPFVELKYSRRDWWSSRFRRWAFRLVAVSVAAQLAVAPLLAWHFATFSPSAFFANPLVVSLAGFCVTGGFAADAIGLVWLGAGKFIAFWVGYGLEAMIAVARWFASFDYSQLRVQSPGLIGIACCWTMLLLGARWVGGERRNAGRLVLVALLWLNAAFWLPSLAAMRNRTEVTFLDLGEATAPVVRFPGGATLLADQCGRSGPGYWVAGELIAPYLYRYCDGRLDYLLLRGRATWSWTGRIIRQFKPPVVIVAGRELPEETTENLSRYASRYGIDVRRITTADTLDIRGAKLYFVPETGLPVLEYEGRRVLLAGETPANVLEEISGKFDVVESLFATESGAWSVTPYASGSVVDRRIVVSRTGAAGFVLTENGIGMETERDNR